MAFFNKKIWSRQSLASLLVLVFLLSMLAINVLLPQKKAQAALNATLPQQIVSWITDKISWVKDYATQNLQKYYSYITSAIQQWTKSDILQQRFLKTSWNKTRKNMLDNLTNDILKQSQGTGGETAFVTDWKGYLSTKVDESGKSFDEKLRIAQTETPAIPNNFYDSFSQGGGWDTWLKMIIPGNNVYGRWMIALDEKTLNQSQTYAGERSKLVANQGYKGTPTTPGIIQSYAAQRASMMDFDYLLQSKDTNEYFGSVIDAFINRIAKEGLGSLGMGLSTFLTSGADIDSFVSDVTNSGLNSLNGALGTKYLSPTTNVNDFIYRATNSGLNAMRSELPTNYLLPSVNVDAFIYNVNQNGLESLRGPMGAAYFQPGVDVNRFINQVTQNGLSSLKASQYVPLGTSPQVTISPQDQNIISLESNYDYALSFPDLLGLLYDNLQSLLPELNRNSLANANQIYQTQKQIENTDRATADMNELIQRMEYVFQAQKGDNQTSLDLTITNYQNALNKAVKSLQLLLLNSQETRLQRLFALLDKYNSQIVDQLNKLYSQSAAPYQPF